MKIVDKDTGRLLYDTGGKEVKVSMIFWDAVRKGKIKYYNGSAVGRGRKREFVTVINFLDLRDKSDFEKAFKKIVLSEIGKQAMLGEISVDTIL